MPLSKKAKAKKAFWNRIKSDLHAETGEAAASSCPESTQQTSMSAEVPAQTSYCPGEGPKPPKVFCDELHAKGESSKMPSLSVQKVTTDVTKSGADHGAEGCSRADPDMNPQPSVTVVRATTSQASNRFGKNANKQCVANSLMFLSFLFEDENITTSDLDSVLDKGNEVYIQAKQRYPNSNPFLATDELPHEVSARRCDYQVDRSQLPINGKFGGTQHYPSLEAQLNRLTADVQYAIVIMASLGFAVFRTRSGRYGYFDPHSRCAQGLPLSGAPSAGGTSVMLTFTSLRDMIDRISISFAIMGISPTTDYELQPVMFYSMNRGIVGNLMADTSILKQRGIHAHNAVNMSDQISEHVLVQPLIEEHVTLSNDSSSNRFAPVMNSDTISENVHALVISADRQEMNNFTENQTHHEPTASIHNSVPPSTSTVSGLYGSTCTLTKLSKQDRRKMKRRLIQSPKTPQRKENQKQKERQKYASDKSYQASKKSYSKDRYQSNPDIRQKKNVYDARRYKDHADFFRKKHRTYIRKSYNEVESFREKHKLRMKEYSSELKSQSNDMQLKKRVYIRNRYRESTDFQLKQRMYIRNRYRESTDFQLKQRMYIRDRYRESTDFQLKQRMYIRDRYRQSTDFQLKQRMYIRNRYRQSSDFQQKQQMYIRNRYRQNSDFQQKQQMYIRNRYRQSSDFQQKQQMYIRNRYRQSSDFQQKQQMYIRNRYRQSSDFQQKQQMYIRNRYRQSSDFQLKQRMYIRNRYRQSEEFRQKQRAHFMQRYRNDTTFRNQHRQLMKEKMRDRYTGNASFKTNHNIRCAMNIKRKYRRMNMPVQPVEAQADNSLIREAISVFRSNIKLAPTYVCTVCHKASFKNQVKQCRRSNYVKNQSMAETCLTGTYVHACDNICRDSECTALDERKKEWICHTCHNRLKSGRMPCLAVVNNLELDEIPPELKDLNILERHLISKCIPFAKIIPLPKGRQRLIRGNLVCVPSEVQETVDALPRLRSESQVMRVKLKRRLCYKGHQLFQTVTWSKLVHALQKLKEIHPQYQDVSIRDEPELCDPTLDSSESSDSDSDMDDYDEADLMEIDRCEQSALCNPEHEPENGQDAEPAEEQRDDAEPEQSLPNGGFALESCLQPVDISEEMLCYGDNTYCVAPAERNSPVSFFKTPKLEALSFPVLYPRGRNTLDERRIIKVSPSAYFKSRLFNIDIRFAKDPNYLFFSQFVTEIHLANSCMIIQLRKGKTMTKDGRQITSGMLQDKQEVEKLVRSKDAIRFMQPLRGTPAYWNKTSKDLFAMIRQLGTATFFVTLSAAELRWTEVIKAIKRQQGEDVDFEALNWSEKCEILRGNPVTSMRMFDKRVEALFRDLLLSEAQPLGKIIDFFYRVEFQHRGSPHIHMMVWVEGAVDPEKDDDLTICAFVDRYISGRLPDPNRQPELYKKVSELQKHSRNHTRTCFKSVNSGCRFGFPKPPSRQTMISRPPENNDTQRAKAKLRPLNQLLNEPEAASMTLNELLSRCNLTLDEYETCLESMNKRTAIILKRDPKDCWINGYNPYLLEAWDSNIDVSFILNAYSCVEYLTKYITKKESGLSDYLKTVMENASTDRVNECDEMRAVMQAYSKKREVSAQECVTRVCGIHMKKCSRSVIFIPTDDNPVKMSRPMSFLENCPDESCNIWMTSLSDKYKSRPQRAEYEQMCLADFASTCRFVPAAQKKGKEVLPLLNDLGYVQRRKSKPAVIRFYHCSQEKQPEQYYGRLLRLYLPHRSEQELKSQGFQTYQSFYSSGWTTRPGSDHAEFVQDIVNENRGRYEKNSEEIEEALEEFEQNRDHVVDEWCNLAPESEVVRLQCDDDIQDDEHEQENVPDYCGGDAASDVRAVRETPVIDPAEVRQMYQNLNQKQACVFYSIRDWCTSRVSGLNPEPFFMYVNGGAGTGKSHLIKCVYSEASKILSRLPAHAEEADMSKPTVLLSAFTGTAAYNISGCTLHSLLKLPRSLKPPIQGLGNQLDEVRSELINTEILVIDEISMISKPLFAYVDARLKQIKGTQSPFGGVSVLAVGDFYQLPPVRHSKPLCVHNPSEIDLWQEHFQMVTLTQIMRQKDDLSFAEMLNRMRVKEKTDKLSQADRELLSQSITEPTSCPNDVLHIFATNKQVAEHNSVTLTLLHSNIVSIDADDFQKDPRTGRMARKDKPCAGGRSELADTLKVAEGARVMLTRNIDVGNGLVNGAFAKLVQVVTSDNDRITKLGLQMDQSRNKDRVVFIERAEENLKQRGVVRRQFPVKLAFACTVHKTQGLTTDAAVVSLKNIFEAGMAYVAVSRVRTLSGLYLLDLDERKIYSNPEITAALQSMRQASVDDMMPLLNLTGTVSRPDILTLVHHNTEGLPAHIKDLKSHHELCLADVLCLTETHLQSSFVADSLHLEGYSMFKRNRHMSYSNFPELSSRSGGGVAVYVRNTFVVNEKRYLHNVTDLEFVVLKVEAPFQALITAVYRPPDFGLKPFMDNLVSLLDSLVMLDCHPVIVCGDFNENQLMRGRKPILDLFESRGYAQLITSATTDKHTLLDLVFISQPRRCLHAGVMRSYYSYHNPVYCLLSFSDS